MSLNLQIAKFVGVSNQTHWSQVHAFIPKDPEKEAQFGSLTAVFALKAKEEGLELASFGTEIIQRFHETYYETAGPVLAKLRLALTKVTDEFGKVVELFVAAAVIIDGEQPLVYFLVNQGWVMLYRDCRLVKILVAEEKMKTASGYLQAEDKVILGTTPFFTKIAQGSLASVLIKDNWESLKDDLGAMIGAKSDNSLMAAALIWLSLTSPLPIAAKPSKPFRRLSLNFPHLNLSFAFGKRVFFKKPPELKKEKKWQLIVATILILILMGSLLWGFKEKNLNLRRQEEQKAFQEASEHFNQGLALMSVSPTRATELFEEAKKILEKLGPPASSEVKDLREKIEEALQKNTKEKVVSAQTFLELAAIKEGFWGSVWSLQEKKVAILDPKQKTLIKVDLETKAGQIVAGGEKLEEAKLVVNSQQGAFILTSDRLLRLSDEGKILQEKKLEGEVNFKSSFAFGDNAYFLAKDQIYKFMAPDLTKVTYLVQADQVLNKALALAIDGSVWVLTENGEILKYTKGNKDYFTIQGLNKPFNEPISLFTSKDCENLYVLDRKNTRVVVLSKEGNYLLSYFWSGIAGASDLVVLEDLKKIFLLTGSRIYEIDLK